MLALSRFNQAYAISIFAEHRIVAQNVVQHKLNARVVRLGDEEDQNVHAVLIRRQV